MNATFTRLLGDCILHADHHELQDECLRANAEWFIRERVRRPHEDIESIIERFRLEYEFTVTQEEILRATNAEKRRLDPA